MFRVVGFIALIVLLGGCSEPAAPAAAVKKKPKKSPLPQVEVAPVEVAADEFATIDTALVELDRAVSLPDGEEHNRAVLRCQKWLLLQQGESVAPLAERLRDSQQSLGMRLTACRILALLGPAGAEPLIAVAKKDDSPQLRRQAIGMLGTIKPTPPAAIDMLIDLLDEPESGVLAKAIEVITKQGEAAKRASPKLGQLRVNHKEEHIRVAAGEALKKVDPRSSFVD